MTIRTTTYVIERRDTYVMTGGPYWLKLNGEPSWPSHQSALIALDKHKDRMRQNGWKGAAEATFRIVRVTEIRSVCP